MPSIEIIGFPASTFFTTACLAAAEKEIDVTTVERFPWEDAVAALSPSRRIPILRHGDLVLFETLGICAYLDGLSDTRALFPADPLAKAHAMNWASFLIDSVNQGVVREIIVPYAVGGADGPDDAGKARISAAMASAERYFQAFEGHLSQAPYLAGDLSSVADLFLFPVASYIRGLPEGARLFAPHRHLANWFERMADRPSVEEVLPRAA